jgi:hypothetical protein
MRKERSRRAIPLDELIGQDVQQHKRAMRLLLSGMALLSVLLIAVVLIGLDARGETVAASATQSGISQPTRLLASITPSDRRHLTPYRVQFYLDSTSQYCDQPQ